MFFAAQCGNRKATEQAITTIASLSLAVGKDFSVYYGWVMPFLKTVIGTANTKEERTLKGKALECISLVGVAVGRDMFRYKSCCHLWDIGCFFGGGC